MFERTEAQVTTAVQNALGEAGLPNLREEVLLEIANAIFAQLEIEVAIVGSNRPAE